MTEVTIDLSLDDNSFKKSYDALFHKEKYEQLSKIIQNRLNFVEANKDDSENVNHNRSHQAVLLNGERGTGKTSILVNLTTFMKEEFKNIENKILFLDPVDPTLLNNNEDFLNVVIAQINKTKVIKEQLEKTKNTDCYYHPLEMLANALEGEQTAKNQTGLDKLLSYQGSLDIAQRAHEYFHEVLKFTDKKLIVIAIDDVDMSLHHGFEILEVVRKYLCSNYVLPIVSGDLNLYQELVHNEFFKQLVHKDSNQTESQKKQAFNLTIEYLRKVFPLHQRIYVPTIEQYCEKANLGQNVKIKNGENPVICSLYEFHQWLLTVLNGRVNGEENSVVKYTPKTARELMQLLGALKPIFTEARFSNLIEFGKLKNRRNVKNDLTILLLSKTKEEGKNIYELFDILSGYFSGGRTSSLSYFEGEERLDLHYLCEALKTINARSIVLSHNGENLFDGTHTHADVKPNDYSLNDLVYFKNNPLDESLVLEDTCTNLKFTRKFFGEVSKNFTEETFLLKLFSHSDYYSSYQTAPLIFFGRFFELITISLMRDIDVKWLQNLLSKPPYYSIFEEQSHVEDYFWELNIQKDEETEEIEFSEDDNEKRFLKELEDNINNVFRNELKKGGMDLIFSDISLFKALRAKYFKQLNLYKESYTGKSPTVKDKDLLNDVVIRASYCYWSALGSFEKSYLFHDDIRISHTNFFATSSLAYNDNEKLRKFNNTYRFNILPFIRLDESKFEILSFTKLLEKHPVFEFMKNISVEMQQDNTSKNESKTFVAKDSRPWIEKSFNGELTESEYDRIIGEVNSSKIKKSILEKINKLKTKMANELNDSFIPFLKSAQFGSLFKTGAKNKKFDTTTDVGRLLDLIWRYYLDEDITVLNDSTSFIQKLTDAGVEEEFANFLSTGIK